MLKSLIRRTSILGFVTFLVSYCTCAVAGTITVVDKDGKALSNAVISLRGSETANIEPTTTPAVMDQVNRRFQPHILVVNKGEYVAFPNSDNIRHHVYSFSTPKQFEIKLYSGDTIDPVIFDKPGIVVLGCNIHDSMVGYIFVKDGQQTWITDENGQAEVGDIDGVADVWHPELSLNHVQRLPFTIAFSKTNQQTVVLERVLPPPRMKNTFGKSKFR